MWPPGGESTFVPCPAWSAGSRAPSSGNASCGLLGPATEIADQAQSTARVTGEAGIAAVQDEPMVCVQHELGRDHFFETQLDLQGSLARCQRGPVSDPEHMRIDGHR